METLGERLRYLRKHVAGSTIASLAADLGVSIRTLMKYEKNETSPDAQFLVRLSERLWRGIDLHWLLTGRGRVLLRERRGAGEDHGLLRSVVGTVEDYLDGQGLSLRPEKKAELIVLLYEELLGEGTMTDDLKGRAMRLIRLAS